MFNPPDRLPGSYVDLLSRMIRNAKRQKAAERVLELIKQIFEQELEKERIVLSRPERKRLFRQVTRAVLTDLLGGLDEKKEV